MTRAMKGKRVFMQGNIAAGEGAIAAGARFFAGYPITPSSEIGNMLQFICPKLEVLTYRWRMKLAVLVR